MRTGTEETSSIIGELILLPFKILFKIIFIPLSIFNLIGQKSKKNSKMETVEETIKEKEEEKKNSFEVLTYNIFLRPPLVATNESDHKDSRTEIFSSLHLDKFDIVCLQEMFSSYNYRQGRIIEAAKKLGFKDFLSIPRNW